MITITNRNGKSGKVEIPSPETFRLLDPYLDDILAGDFSNLPDFVKKHLK